jgi:Zn-dependent peptidase ImmA (M78 family)
VEDFVEQLKDRYNGAIPFKRICEDENIIITKAKLNDGVKGFYISVNGTHVILLNEKLTQEERRDWSFHELFHHFKSVPGATNHLYHSNKRDETKADLFAALCRAPDIIKGDTIETVAERYNVSRWLAKIRIEYEIKKESQ